MKGWLWLPANGRLKWWGEYLEPQVGWVLKAPVADTRLNVSQRIITALRKSPGTRVCLCEGVGNPTSKEREEPKGPTLFADSMTVEAMLDADTLLHNFARDVAMHHLPCVSAEVAAELKDFIAMKDSWTKGKRTLDSAMQKAVERCQTMASEFSRDISRDLERDTRMMVGATMCQVVIQCMDRDAVSACLGTVDEAAKLMARSATLAAIKSGAAPDIMAAKQVANDALNPALLSLNEWLEKLVNGAMARVRA